MTCTPAEAFPPSEYLRDELEERSWTVADLAEAMGQPVRVVAEMLNKETAITTETARALSEALGTTPEVWLNLQTRYRLHWKVAAAPAAADSLINDAPEHVENLRTWAHDR